MTDPMKDSCRRCFYFIRENESGGTCHRNPPLGQAPQPLFYHVITGEIVNASIELAREYARFPEVKNTDWCGEFEK